MRRIFLALLSIVVTGCLSFPALGQAQGGPPGGSSGGGQSPGGTPIAPAYTVWDSDTPSKQVGEPLSHFDSLSASVLVELPDSSGVLQSFELIVQRNSVSARTIRSGGFKTILYFSGFDCTGDAFVLEGQYDSDTFPGVVDKAALITEVGTVTPVWLLGDTPETVAVNSFVYRGGGCSNYNTPRTSDYIRAEKVVDDIYAVFPPPYDVVIN